MGTRAYMNWCEHCGSYVRVSGNRQTADGDDIFDCGHTHGSSYKLAVENRARKAAEKAKLADLCQKKP